MVGVRITAVNLAVVCTLCADNQLTTLPQPTTKKKGFVVAKNQLILIFDRLSASILSHIVTMLNSLMYVLK